MKKKIHDCWSHRYTLGPAPWSPPPALPMNFSADMMDNARLLRCRTNEKMLNRRSCLFVYFFPLLVAHRRFVHWCACNVTILTARLQCGDRLLPPTHCTDLWNHELCDGWSQWMSLDFVVTGDFSFCFFHFCFAGQKGKTVFFCLHPVCVCMCVCPPVWLGLACVKSWT